MLRAAEAASLASLKWSHDVSQIGEAVIVNVVQLRQRLAEEQAQAQAATSQAATLQQLRESERQQQEEEREATRVAAVRQCTAAEAAQQRAEAAKRRAEADARAARAELAVGKAEVRPVELASGYSANQCLPRFCKRARPTNVPGSILHRPNQV